MLESLFDECRDQWMQAKYSKKHSFRFFTLATIASDGRPHLRTVVLRDFNAKDFTFTVFTDLRSQKIKELDQDNRAQLLFYDPKRMLQIIVSVILLESINDHEIYNAIPEKNKKDYAAVNAPGSQINSPDALRVNFSKGHFSKLIFKAATIEYLLLKSPNHLRALFKEENNWQGTFLVP
ncbi:MAG: pyridoxamine 5'-phosphate oxidase [Flavobacteriaceae bacterium]|jgi:pyridoxamine 5'-phosphate oxidase|tara:strand:+ start:1450 stop:1986 length:537 start_codon:yes stop_codon:yes gene_type:complete